MTQTVQSPLTQVRRGNGAPLVSTADLPPRGQFIANEFIADKGGELLDIVNPADESVITQVLVGTAADVDRAVDAAIAANSGWAQLRATTSPRPSTRSDSWPAPPGRSRRRPPATTPRATCR